MRSPVPFVAVRTGGLVLLDVAATSLGDLLPSEGGANIGFGLLVFLALVVAASVWAARDGRRGGRAGTRLPPLAACWAAVVVLVAAATAVWISVGSALHGGGFSLEVLASDLRSVTPFTAGLIGVPALIALAVVHSGTRPEGSAAR